MRTRDQPVRNCVPPRLMAADWTRLTDRERDQAMEAARREGRRAACWYLAEQVAESPHRSPLRDSRWAQQHEDLDRLDDSTFFLYVSLNTLACEDDYITYVIEAYCPERAGRWWGTTRTDRLEDPRVCAFCDGYERERCQILGLVAPPTGITDLQLYLGEAKELERERGRSWLTSTETTYGAEEDTTSQRFVMRWEYRRCMLATDLAQMLLDDALHRARLLRARVYL
jgi:hypothetical protein